MGVFDELMKDTFNAATRYLGKSRRIQTKEQSHSTFSNLGLKRKLRETVRFFGGIQPVKLAEEQNVIINETVTSLLEGGNINKINTSWYTLETYDKIPIFITADITENAVKLEAEQTLLGYSGTGGTESEALQG